MKKRTDKIKNKPKKIKKEGRKIKQGPLFIANVVSVILLVYVLAVNPSITGFAVKNTMDITHPPDFAILFIIVTFALDIYFYMKGRRVK